MMPSMECLEQFVTSQYMLYLTKHYVQTVKTLDNKHSHTILVVLITNYNKQDINLIMPLQFLF